MNIRDHLRLQVRSLRAEILRKQEAVKALEELAENTALRDEVLAVIVSTLKKTPRNVFKDS